MTPYSLDVVEYDGPTSKKPFGCWSIHYGRSSVLVAEGPAGALAFGRLLFDKLTEAYRNGEDIFLGTKQDADDED